MTDLNHSGHVALYQQIAGDIESDIAERRLGPLDKLPSETELRALYGVSRVTVRQAVELLVRRNLVFRRQGKGTFVTGPALVHELHELRGIYETIEATGLALRTRLLTFDNSEPPDDVRKVLGTRAGVMRLKRLYLVDEVPLGLIVCWLPPEAERFTAEDAEKHTIYGLLRGLDQDVTRADLAISGRLAGRRLGRLFGCAANTPLLVLERVSYGAAGAARESTRFFVRSDNYRFTVSLQGPMPLAGNLRPS